MSMHSIIGIDKSRIHAAIAPVLGEKMTSDTAVRLIIDSYPDAFYDVPDDVRRTLSVQGALEIAHRSMLAQTPRPVE